MSAKALDLNLGAGPDRSTAALILLGGLVGCLSALLAVMLGPAALGVPVLAVIALLLVRHPLVAVRRLRAHRAVQAGARDRGPAFRRHRRARDPARWPCASSASSRGAPRRRPFMFLVPLLVIAIHDGDQPELDARPDYGLSKTLRFVTLTSIGAFAPFCLLESRDDLIRLLKVFAGCALVAGLLVGVFGSTAAENRLEFGGAANTIFTSRFLLSGALVLILGAMLKVFPRHRVALALLGLGLVGLAAGIGSRGPIVGLALAMVCTLAAVVLRQPARVLSGAGRSWRRESRCSRSSRCPRPPRERLQGLAENPVGTLERGPPLAALRQGDRADPGRTRSAASGPAGFFLYSYVLTNREERYPHNVFLEASSELGLFPAVLLALSVCADADRPIPPRVGGLDRGGPEPGLRDRRAVPAELLRGAVLRRLQRQPHLLGAARRGLVGRGARRAGPSSCDAAETR